jgi:peptidoglycan hydrolase CwlO-like protein
VRRRRPLLCGSGSSEGSLAGRYAAGQHRANGLQQSIKADSKLIKAYEGRIGNREAQLVADYESPRPTLVDLVLQAHGFDDLVNGLSSLKVIARANAHTIQVTKAARLAVAAETRRLTEIQARRKRATVVVLVERDEIAQLRLTIVGRELAVSRDRTQKSGQLQSLRRALVREAGTLQQQAARAEAASFAIGAPPAGAASTRRSCPTAASSGSSRRRARTTGGLTKRSSPCK